MALVFDTIFKCVILQHEENVPLLFPRHSAALSKNIILTNTSFQILILVTKKSIPALVHLYKCTAVTVSCVIIFRVIVICAEKRSTTIYSRARLVDDDNSDLTLLLRIVVSVELLR
jgi:hypothetical protein